MTGASGHVGSAIVPLLLSKGHSITGLARSQASADKLVKMGVEPILGSQSDLPILTKAASEADVILHLAFDHEIMGKGDWAGASNGDLEAINAMGTAIAGSGKTFMVASGTLGLAGKDETSGRSSIHSPRKSEETLSQFTSKNVRTIVLRLPPVVHSNRNEHPFITGQINFAKEKGYAPYVGQGDNTWESAHVDDVADLVVRSLDPNTVPSGSNIHAVGQEGIPVKDIAEFVAKKLGVETKSVTKEEQAGLGGFIGMVLGLGGQTTTKLTREWTGWNPTGPTLFEDLEGYSGFKQ